MLGYRHPTLPSLLCYPAGTTASGNLCFVLRPVLYVKAPWDGYGFKALSADLSSKKPLVGLPSVPLIHILCAGDSNQGVGVSLREWRCTADCVA